MVEYITLVVSIVIWSIIGVVLWIEVNAKLDREREWSSLWWIILMMLCGPVASALTIGIFIVEIVRTVYDYGMKRKNRVVGWLMNRLYKKRVIPPTQASTTIKLYKYPNSSKFRCVDCELNLHSTIACPIDCTDQMFTSTDNGTEPVIFTIPPQ